MNINRTQQSPQFGGIFQVVGDLKLEKALGSTVDGVFSSTQGARTEAMLHLCDATGQIQGVCRSLEIPCSAPLPLPRELNNDADVQKMLTFRVYTGEHADRFQRGDKSVEHVEIPAEQTFTPDAIRDALRQNAFDLLNGCMKIIRK